MTVKSPTLAERLAGIDAKLDGMIGETQTYRQGHDERHRGIEKDIAGIKDVQANHADAISQQKAIYKILIGIGGFITFATATAVAIFKSQK